MTASSPPHPAFLRTALTVSIAVALALTGAAGSAWAADPPPPPGSVPPDQDPFYKAPANIGSYRPGQVVASRQMTPADDNLAASVRAWQLSYRTNDSHSRPELTVTTLLVPKKAWTGKGKRPVVSVQAPEDSTGTQCAPSYGLASGQGVAGLTGPFLVNAILEKNWAVAMPDFEGPKSVFMAGLQAGHAVLDGIRAVRNFNRAGIGRTNPWAVEGYSGGAQATGWAAELQPSYAPDVKLAGAAMGGTPADPEAVARFIDGGPFAGFEAAATVSLATEYEDQIDVDKLTTAEGKKLLEASRGKCTPELIFSFAFKKLKDYSTVPDPLAVPEVQAVLKENTMGSAAPTAPVYNYHGNLDEIVPVPQADTLTKAWCRRGAKIQIVRDALAEHLLGGLRRGDALNYLGDRFDGKPAPDDC